MTQRRKGYASEGDLDALRLRYLEMARGLPLSVMFNTTVFAGNLHEIPALADFFARHNDVVRFASFQLGADTGRGTAPGSDPATVTQRAVCEAIERGAGVKLDFDALQAGHRACNRYAVLLSIGRHRFDALADAAFAARAMHATADAVLDRGQGWRGAWSLARVVGRKPRLWGGLARQALRIGWRSREAWWLDGARAPPVRKLSFFVHSFMDGRALEAERVEACVFMAATIDGPVSMCAYNAQREGLLLRPVLLADGSVWQPLAVAPDARGEVRIPLKWLKGKAREAAIGERRTAAVGDARP